LPYLWYEVSTALQYEIVPDIKHLGELDLTSIRNVFKLTDIQTQKNDILYIDPRCRARITFFPD